MFFSPEMWLALWYCTVQLRHLLLSIGIWGAVDDSVQTRLHRAYLEFKRWCATHKIACSQPAFQQKMVAWICLFFLVCQEITKLDELYVMDVYGGKSCWWSCIPMMQLMNSVVPAQWGRDADLQSVQWTCGDAMVSRNYSWCGGTKYPWCRWSLGTHCTVHASCQKIT